MTRPSLLVGSSSYGMGCPECGSLITDRHEQGCTWEARHPRIRSYVAGFGLWFGQMLLVQKRKPVWQNGLWNAVGGVVEPNESPATAMVREFHEETGLAVPGWRHVAVERGPGYEVFFYSARFTDNYRPKVPEFNDVGERLNWHLPDMLLSRASSVVGNLRWLIPLVLDWRHIEPVTIITLDDIKKKASW
jgi:8-oxo-dGTP pyrophosphatase MutT (NUDIX family)